VSEYLQEHNEKEHNYHTDLEESGFDICIECDLIRRTGGLYQWQESELVTMDTYASERRINA
jgi:hypothetical protein